jgi:hypothetical protein
MLVTITDTAGTSGTATTDTVNVSDTIASWFSDAPEDDATEIATAIDNLQTALNRHEDSSGWETYLGINIAPEHDITVALMAAGVDDNRISETPDGTVTITRTDGDYVIVGEDNGWWDYTTYSGLDTMTQGSNDLGAVARDIAAWAER